VEREFAPTLLDLAGVRILLYRPRDEEPTCDVIDELFTIPAGDRFRRDFQTPGGYQARHRVVSLRDEMLASDPGLRNLEGVLCEVQVVTFGDHMWNELEHDILYKTPTGHPSEAQSQMLRVLRQQLGVVKASVDELMDATERQRAANLTTIDSPDDLSDALKSRVGQRLRGDFEQLWKLLVGALSGLTRGALDQLPLDEQDLDHAVARLGAAGVVDFDGVGLVVAALWPTYGQDFVEIASSWRGRPGSLLRLLHALQQAQANGRI
jgi:ppGpp synthetase/RelA/SpoT-type nucleotidyltranferase